MVAKNRMKKAATPPQRPTLRDLPFDQLVTAVGELAEARREYSADEARTVIERAATLAPADYELPRNNLKELDKRMQSTRRA